MGSGTYPANGTTDLVDGSYEQATLTTAISGNNNDLVYTAVPLGDAGNGISIEYVKPTDDNQAHALAITTDLEELTISISLAVDTDGSTVLTTGDLLKTAIAADTEGAALLVTVADKAANDGSGLLGVMTADLLTGGSGGQTVSIESKSYDGQTLILETEEDGDYTWGGQGDNAHVYEAD